jgi:hypothetical protein
MAEASAHMACRAIAFALGEFKTARQTHDDLRLREAAEKAWLAVTEATDHYLGQRGVTFPSDIMPAEMHRFRRTNLEERKEKGDTDAATVLGDYLDLRDSLHGDCFYGGACGPPGYLHNRLNDARAYIVRLTGCVLPEGA